MSPARGSLALCIHATRVGVVPQWASATVTSSCGHSLCSRCYLLCKDRRDGVFHRGLNGMHDGSGNCWPLPSRSLSQMPSDLSTDDDRGMILISPLQSRGDHHLRHIHVPGHAWTLCSRARMSTCFGQPHFSLFDGSSLLAFDIASYATH
jgi:hypothetical protein